jgi:hypothetical protein
MRRATRWVAIFIYVTDACRYLIDVALEARSPGPRRCLGRRALNGAYRDCVAVKEATHQYNQSARRHKAPGVWIAGDPAPPAVISGTPCRARGR